MSIVIILIILLLGGLISLSIKPNLQALELSGISFPMGFGIWSILLWSLDLVGFAINNKLTILLSCMILLGLLVVLTVKKRHKINLRLRIFDYTKFKTFFLSFRKLYSINPLYILLFVLTSFILFTIISKALFWPIMNYDSIDGYDLIAKVIGSEGHYNNSVFSIENPLHNTRSFYPPLLVHALSIGYIFGEGHSKISAVLFLLSTVIFLYSIVQKRSGHFLAILAVFLLCIIPEFLGQSALTASNPVAACYLLICFGYFDLYLLTQERNAFFLSLIALSFTIWTRTEAIIFAIPLGILIIYKSKITNALKDLGILISFTAIPFVLWQLFIKTLSQATNVQPIIKEFYFDPEKLLDLLGQVKLVVFNTQFYALGFYFILFFLASNIFFYKRSKSTLSMSFILVTSFILYIWVYYQIDTDYKILHEGSWIGSGLKRGLFYFLPIGCYCISCSYLMRRLFGIEKT